MTTTNQPQPLSPQQLRLRWLAGGLFLLAFAGPLSIGWLALAGCADYFIALGITVSGTIIFTMISSSMAFSILGCLIIIYRPSNRIGWLCLWVGIGLSILLPIEFYVACGVAGHLTAPGLAYVAWFWYSFGGFGMVPMFALLPLLYPTGRFLSPRWRWLTIAGLIVFVIVSIAMGLLPDFSQGNSIDTSYPVTNPFGLAQLPDWWYPLFRNTSKLLIFLLGLAAIAAMIVRLKRSTGNERQQMKWLTYFLSTAVLVQLLVFELPGAFFYPQIFETIWYELIIMVVFLGFPLTIGLAIFKYRLYAIDLIIRRTLIYGVLTAALALVYIGSVVLLQALFRALTGQTSQLVIVASTLAIAALFNPLRRRVQDVIDRRFYRRKYNAAKTLAAFSGRMRDEVELEALTNDLLAVVEETMQPAHVSLWLREIPAVPQRNHTSSNL